jgi:RNA polymerase sigma factor for flagellar operon FliA
MATTSDPELLVRGHMSLVEREVRRLVRKLPQHVDRDDLTSAGLTALVLCAMAYTGEPGASFERLARVRVRGALVDQLRRLDWASRSVRHRARNVHTAQERLVATLRRMPTSAELADTLGMRPAEVVAAVSEALRAVVLSLPDIARESAGFLLGEPTPSPEDLLLRREQVGYLHDAVAALPDRLRTVVVRYFFQERPIAETAAELGISESRAARLRTQALRLLRDGLNSQLDPDLLPEQRSPAGGCVARRREAYYADITARGDLRSRLATNTIRGV